MLDTPYGAYLIRVIDMLHSKIIPNASEWGVFSTSSTAIDLSY